MKRVHVVVHGYVQGILFRTYTESKAKTLGVKGWIRNNEDGTVEAVFSGLGTSVEKMIKWCEFGPPGARIDKVDVEEQEFKSEFHEFEIKN